MSIVNSSRCRVGVGLAAGQSPRLFLLIFRRCFELANKAIVKTISFEGGADMLALSAGGQAGRTGLEAKLRARQVVTRIAIFSLVLVGWLHTGRAADATAASQAAEKRIQTLIPDIERYISSGMKTFDVPGLAIGIIANDKLVYSKGFGIRDKKNGGSVDTRTVFQIGSTTKAFLATTMAIMVDRGRFKWDDRVVDLYPDFQMKDPWVTREFRVFDLLAQRSGLPPLRQRYAGNDRRRRDRVHSFTAQC